MKRALALILALAMVFSLVACGGGDETETQSEPTKVDTNTLQEKKNEDVTAVKADAEYKDEVIIGIDTKYSTIDIQESAVIASSYAYQMTHEPLVHYYEGEFIPTLAEKWEISEDAKTYTFYLRKGVKFHDGSDFSADDVIFTFQRLLDRPTSHAALVELANMLESFTKVDDYTVKLVLKTPNPDYLVDLSCDGSMSILSKTACEKYEDGYKYGTGPWMNDSFAADDHHTLVRNENYWGEMPVTKKVTFRLIPEASARLIALQNGEIDVCIYPDPAEYQFVEEDPNLDMVTYPAGLNYIYFNLDHAPLDDVNFRLALAYATDVQQIIDGAASGYGIVGTTTNSPSSSSYFDDWESVGLTAYGRDLDKAKEYMAKSKYADGVTVKMQYTTAQREIISQILQEQWKDIGVTVEHDKTDSAGRTAAKKADDWQCYMGSVAYSAAPGSFSETFQTGGGTNQQGYSNPELDKLFEDAAAETDQAKRLEMYKQAQIIIHEECPILQTFYAIKCIAFNKNLSGVKWESRGLHEFSYVKVEK